MDEGDGVDEGVEVGRDDGTTAAPGPPSDEQIGLFAFRLVSQMSGAVTAAMVHIGDRLGLYATLAAAPGQLTSAELAEAAGLSERWVREWAYNQAAAGLLVADAAGRDAGDERFSLAPEALPVLVDQAHDMHLVGMFHQLPQVMGKLERARPELPHRHRLRLRQLRRRDGGGHRPHVRALDGGAPGPRRPATVGRGGRPSGGGHRRGRRRVRCGPRGPGDGPGVPGQPARATTPPTTRWTGRRSSWPGAGSPTPRSATRRAHRCRPTARSASSPPSTACTT